VAHSYPSQISPSLTTLLNWRKYVILARYGLFITLCRAPKQWKKEATEKDGQGEVAMM
jgi:hypothetical protein